LLLSPLGVASAQEPPGGAGEASADAAHPAQRDPGRMSVADVAACMRGNVVDRGSLRELEIVSIDREGKRHRLRMKLFWKPAKDAAGVRTTLRVVEPREYAGASYLVLAKPEGEEIYLYLPALDRVQRVVGDQRSRPLFGTDFTHTELKQVQGLLEEGETQRLADATLSERAVFVLDTATDAESTGYTHVTSYVDQATCTLLKSELFAQVGAPRKILEGDLSTLLSVDPWWLILGYSMTDLRAGTRTNLRLSDLYLLERLPEALFDPASFHRVEP
jgi:hypothetical protein